MFATINKRLTFRNACAQLGIPEENVYDENNGKKGEKKVGEIEGALLELQTDKEEDTFVADEGDFEVFAEGESGSSDDEEDLRNK